MLTKTCCDPFYIFKIITLCCGKWIGRAERSRDTRVQLRVALLGVVALKMEKERHLTGRLREEMSDWGKG